MTHELKSCPFCGGADVREDHNMRNHFEEIYCDECGAKVSVEGVHSDAVTAWNRRPSPPPPVEVSEEMVDRAAKAMCEHDHGPGSASAWNIHFGQYRDSARAAISAIGGHDD